MVKHFRFLDIFRKIQRAIIDGILITLVSATVVGSIVGIAYHLTKDALPFLDGQSLGKKLIKIRVISSDTNQPITNMYGESLIRSVTLLIPIFNVNYQLI